MQSIILSYKLLVGTSIVLYLRVCACAEGELREGGGANIHENTYIIIYACGMQVEVVSSTREQSTLALSTQSGIRKYNIA